MKYQRRNSATRGQSSHNVYTRALNEILFTTEHVWPRTHDLWQTSQSLYRHTHRGAKILWSLEPHSFLPQYPLRLASTSTKQPTSYTHTWTDTPIMKYQRRNSATRGQSSHNVYTRALNEILFTTEHVWPRTHDLWQTSQSLYRHTHRGAKILWSLEPHSFLPQYPLRLASTSTKQPTSYTHTSTDTPIMKYQRRNSATRGQSSHNVYTRALNEILFTTEHVWARTHDLWHTSQSLYRHTHRGAKNIAIIGTSQLPPTIPAPTCKHIKFLIHWYIACLLLIRKNR